MRRHAASHGLAVLVTSIAASLLTAIMKDLLPFTIEALEGVARVLVEISSLPITAQALAIILVASGLALVWGIAFHQMHEGQDGGWVTERR